MKYFIIIILTLLFSACADKIETVKNVYKGKDVSGKLVNGNHFNLYSSDSKYTVLYFMDIDCSNCIRETPLINNVYRKAAKNQSVNLVMVNMFPEDAAEFNDYVKENNFEGFIISELDDNSFWIDYQVNSAPLLFIMDEDKNVIIERLNNAKDLEKALNQLN